MSLTTDNIDDEWSNFISNTYEDESSADDTTNVPDDEFNEESDELNSTIIFNGSAPEPTDIYISTKSKIAYLAEPIDLKIFWEIPVMPYATPLNGVIKKQIKLNSKACIADIHAHNFAKFIFHFKGIIRAIKQLKIYEKSNH